jgi:hypothetical protein
MRILRPIVEPKADLLPIGDAISFIAATAASADRASQSM